MLCHLHIVSVALYQLLFLFPVKRTGSLQGNEIDTVLGVVDRSLGHYQHGKNLKYLDAFKCSNIMVQVDSSIFFIVIWEQKVHS